MTCRRDCEKPRDPTTNSGGSAVIGLGRCYEHHARADKVRAREPHGNQIARQRKGPRSY